MAAPGTVGDVVEKALGLAQLDNSLKPIATGYLNEILKKFSSQYQWPYFRKVAETVTLIPGQYAYDLPEDYSRSDDCYLFRGNQRGPMINIVDGYRFRQLAGSNTAGTPQWAMVNLGQDERTIQFNSVPSDENWGYSLAYYRLPATVDVEGGNDSDPVDFEDTNSLIQELVAWLMKWTDDQRQGQQGQESMMALRDAKINSYDLDDDSVVDFAASKFRIGSRPVRGGSGGNGWGNV